MPNEAAARALLVLSHDRQEELAPHTRDEFQTEARLCNTEAQLPRRRIQRGASGGADTPEPTSPWLARVDHPSLISHQAQVTRGKVEREERGMRLGDTQHSLAQAMADPFHQKTTALGR